MKKYIDLSIKLTENTPVYPGEPDIVFKQHASIKENGFNEHQVTINAHFGTHIDFPYHMLDKGKKSDAYNIEKFIGRGSIIDLTNHNLELDGLKGEIILVHTGHLDNGIENLFKNVPQIDENSINWIIDRKPKLVMFDIPTPDTYPFKIHKKLLENDILIVENVINMRQLYGKKFNVFAMPLNFSDFDGSPCRVFAEVLD